MYKTARVVIELEYDLELLLESMEQDERDALTSNDIVDMLEEDVYDDISDLMRTDHFKHWATITLE